MTKINKKLIFLALLVVIASGCSGSESTTNEIDVFTGIEGLSAEFLKGAPPPRVFEESSFPILLRIRNKGAYSIPSGNQGVLSISRETDYVRSLQIESSPKVSKGMTENEMRFFADGKSQINPTGEEVVASLSATTGKLDPQSEHRVSAISANLCYPYKTMLSTTVCIDPDTVGLRPGKKICSSKDITFSNGQGAPVAVVKIEPQMIPEADKNIVKPQFLIYVENRGIGTPVNIAGFQNACGNDVDRKDTWNVAYLKAFTSGKEQLSCCPDIKGNCPPNEISTGFIRFRDRKDFVRCTFKNGIPRNYDAYTSPLMIEVEYGYVQSVTTEVTIQKPLKY